MIFSIPTFLPWLAAALLPWVLHLFLFRKAEPQRFPSLFFLKQCYGWSTRIKLRRLLLLLTRSALILYFILGMLDPRVERAVSTAPQSRAGGTVLLVLDDRPEMRMKLLARPESLFDVYRQSLLEDLEKRPNSQEIAAIPLSDLSVLSSVKFTSPREAAAKIRNASVQTLAAPAEENLRFALERFQTTLLFFSPFQLDLRNPALARVGPASPCEPNFTLSALTAPAQAFVGQPVSVRTAVTDLFGRPADAMVRLRLDDQEVGVSSAEAGEATFLLTGLPAGKHLLKAELVTAGSDAYPEDDLRTAQLTVMPDQAVGFVANTVPPALEAALRAFDNSKTDLLSSAADWETKQRVVILDFHGADLGRVQNGLDRGLDLILFADAMKSDLDLAQLRAILKLEISPDQSLASIDAGILQTVWNAGAGGRFSAETGTRFLSLIRKWRITPRKNDAVLASFSDGSAAVVRHPAGAGSVTLVAFSAADPILQTDPSFLLFVQGLLAPDPGTADPSAGTFVGIPLKKNASIPIGLNAPAAPVRLLNASSSASLSLGYSQGQFFAEIPTPAPPPGIYRMLIGDDEKATVHLYPAPPAPLALPGGSAGFRRSIDFEPVFFWIAVLLMAVELLLLRMTRAPSNAS